MKTLGLIGGISWVSTVDYYKLINQGINSRLGRLNSAQRIMYSFNFEEIKRNNDANDWESTFQMVHKACSHLQSSGAEAIVLCANTMHLIAERLEKAIKIPVIHIATETAAAIEKSGINKAALLGTRFTMELDFFKSKLAERGIEAIIPETGDREFIHHTIFEELGKEIFLPETKQRYLSIIQNLVKQGAQGVILGCTEIPMIVKQEEIPVPAFDTLAIHVNAAIEFSLS